MKLKYRVWNGQKYLYNFNDGLEYLKIDDQNIELLIDIKDKFGREIFEGDIVKYKSLMGNETVGYVKFKQGSFRISKLLNAEPDYKGEVHQWNDGYNYWYSLENIESFDIEIIGNINNNSDLL